MTNESTPPQAVGSGDGLGLLVKRLRECVTMKHETALMHEAADQLDAARAVGILQEQVIMGHEREIATLREAIERACAGYPEDDAAAPTCVAILRQALKA